jgi:uncharacterized protein (TIGR03067 family)
MAVKFATLLLSLTLWIPSALAGDDAKAMDLKALQGDWVGHGFYSGNKLPLPLTLTIDGDVYVLRSDDATVLFTGKIELNTKTNPKQIDVRRPDQGGVLKTALAIYKFEDGKFYMSYYVDDRLFKNRPAGFPKDSDNAVLILEKKSVAAKNW